MRSLLATGASAAVLLLAIGTAKADLFLNGVLAYIADTSTGANVGNANEWDTFPSTPNLKVPINGVSTNISFPLVMGDNIFTYSGITTTPGLGLFLGTDGTPVNGPFGRVPELVTFGAGSAPSAGTLISTLGVFSPTVPYSGATTFSDGVLTASVTSLTVSGGSGTFVITVIPAPASLGLLALAGLATVRRRR